MIILLALGSFFYAIAGSYVPSIIFYLPFYLKNLTLNKYINSVLPLTILISLLLAIIINNDISYIVALKTTILCLIYPISFNFGNYLSEKIEIYSRARINKYLIFSNFLLLVIFVSKIFYYEPSAIARTYVGAALLFYFITLEKKIKLKISTPFILFIVLSFIALLINNSLTLYLYILGGLVTFFSIRIINIIKLSSLRINKKLLWVFIYMIIFLAFFLLLNYQFNLISERRFNNFINLWKAINSFDKTLLLSLGGGRFLITYTQYSDFFSNPLDFSSFFLDPPIIKSNNEYLPSLIKYSGLNKGVFLVKRGGALVPFLLFNLRILAIPFLSHIGIVFLRLQKFFKNKFDLRYKIFFSFLIFYIVYTGFISSPTSLCLPWIIFGFVNSRVSLINPKKDMRYLIS